MRKVLLIFCSFLICLCVHAQKDVTKFLGFPVDGSKSQMIRNLQSKGFKIKNKGDHEYMTGRFNGADVRLFIATENGKVSRIMLNDMFYTNDTNVKIRFNKLCDQFNNNPKYISFEDCTIPDTEDVAYEMVANKKRYQAVFYQRPDSSAFESVKSSIMNDLLQQYTQEQIELLSDEQKESLVEGCVEQTFKYMQNKPVWFVISEFMGEYSIAMFYDNEYNRAHGEDL